MKELRAWLVFFSLLAIYLWRLLAIKPLNLPNQAQIRLTGRISQQPYLKGSQQIINIDGIMIRTEPFPVYFYNQKLTVIGKVEKKVINRFVTRFSLYYPQILIIDHSTNLTDKVNIRTWLLKFKTRLEQGIEKNLSEPQASLLNGILLGSKRNLPEKFSQSLRKTGTIHVVVASGYNITVVAGFLTTALIWLTGRRWAMGLAMLGVWLYILMAGADPPLVRAGIMAGVAFLAQFLGREKDGLNALFLAAILMLLVRPLILFDLGFQLSFLATAGILLIKPLFQAKIFRLPILGDELTTTLAAQLGVMPVLLINFGEINLISLLINTLVLPLIPLMMILGVMAAFGSLVSGLIAQALGWLAWLPLTYFVKQVEWFSYFDWPLLSLEKFSWLWLAGYYLVLGGWVVQKRRKLSLLV